MNVQQVDITAIRAALTPKNRSSARATMAIS